MTVAGVLILWLTSALGSSPALARPPAEFGLASSGTEALCRPASGVATAAFAAVEEDGYYAFQLVPTDQMRALRLRGGTASVSFQESPFGIAVAEDGAYALDVTLQFPTIRIPSEGFLTVWLTTPSLDQVERVGTVLSSEPFSAPVVWNKFLVVITLESTDDPDATSWTGPLVSRGMSRSGLMHTMAGHGPFEVENCAAFGYGSGG